MKTRTLISILIPVLAVLIITRGYAITPKTKEKRDGVTEAEYKFYLDIIPCHFSGAFTHPFSKAFTQVQQKAPTILLYQNHI